jgi:hypothetical protein
MNDRYGKTTLRALHFVKAGAKPLDAWSNAWEEISAPKKSKPCPKWAFCLLCHHGHVKGIAAGCCPDSDGRKDWVLRLLEKLRLDDIIWTDEKKLKRVMDSVFGEMVSVPGKKRKRRNREPSQEIEVLLSLWRTGSI